MIFLGDLKNVHAKAVQNGVRNRVIIVPFQAVDLNQIRGSFEF